MSLSAWCTVEHCIYIRTENTTSNRQLKVVKLLAGELWKRASFVLGFRQIQKPIVQVSHSLWSKIRVVSDKNTTNSAFKILSIKLRSEVIRNIVIFKDFLQSTVLL